jgi:hypothetical protein
VEFLFSSKDIEIFRRKSRGNFRLRLVPLPSAGVFFHFHLSQFFHFKRLFLDFLSRSLAR